MPVTTEKKTNLKELQGILEGFTGTTIQEAMTELFEGAHCRKSYKDFPDPGPEVEEGTDRRVPREEVAHLERIIAEPNLLPVHFLEEGGVVQHAVARVTLVEPYGSLPAGSGWGTGFLVSPTLFMTNNHVIPTDSFARKVEMQFNYQLDFSGVAQSVDAYSPDPDNLFYTNSSLDFTLIRLNRRCRWTFLRERASVPTVSAFDEDVYEQLEYTLGEQSNGLERAPTTAQPFPWPHRRRRICTTPGRRWGYLQLRDSVTYAGPSADQPGQHLNIIQHPQGRRKEVALQRNNITNVYTNVIRYATDTEPGSSGSPVFNNQWDLLAIHHAAGEWDSVNNVWKSNEGMRIDKVVADLRSHFGGSPTGQNILAELGI